MRLKAGDITRTTLNPDGTITVHIPIKIQRRGGRTTIIAPDGTEQQKFASLRKLEQEHLSHIRMTPVIAALVKAHQWKEEILSGKIGTLSALALREKVNVSYVSRVFRLTLLAPDIIEAILAGNQPETLKLHNLFKPFPVLWTEQRKHFGFAAI